MPDITTVTRRSGTSICGEFPARSGNRELKNALFRSAWIASCHDPVSKAHYQRKRALRPRKETQRRHHLPHRRRCDVIFAMLKTEPSTRTRLPKPLD